MLLLAVETSSRRGSVALFEGDVCRREVVFPEGLIHGREITARIDELLRAEGRRARDLTAIAVSVGPGSFTGIRVGVTAAKTMAYALEIPVVTESSLFVTAANAARASLKERALTVLDARQGFFFWGLFETAPLSRLAPDSAGEPAEIFNSIRARGAAASTGGCVIGEGADLFLENSSLSGWRRGPTEWDLPLASVLGELALRRASGARYDAAVVHGLEPVYLRATEAERKFAARSRT